MNEVYCESNHLYRSMTLIIKIDITLMVSDHYLAKVCAYKVCSNMEWTCCYIAGAP